MFLLLLCLTLLCLCSFDNLWDPVHMGADLIPPLVHDVRVWPPGACHQSCKMPCAFLGVKLVLSALLRVKNWHFATLRAIPLYRLVQSQPPPATVPTIMIFPFFLYINGPPNITSTYYGYYQDHDVYEGGGNTKSWYCDKCYLFGNQISQEINFSLRCSGTGRFSSECFLQ